MSNTWNASLEGSPAQSGVPSSLGTRLRETLVDVRERVENEHSSYTTKGGTSGGTAAADFLHKEGSARAYYATSAPTLRPDGVTGLSAADEGRMWFDASGYRIYVWNGSSWVSYGFPYTGVYIQFPGEGLPATLFGGTWTNISSTFAGDFFRAEGGNASLFESGEQAASRLDHPGTGVIGSTNPISFGSFFDSSSAGTTQNYFSPPTGTILGYRLLFRPVNVTVRIWRRTA